MRLLYFNVLEGKQAVESGDAFMLVVELFLTFKRSEITVCMRTFSGRYDVKAEMVEADVAVCVRNKN